MSKSVTYEKVSNARLKCMKKIARQRVEEIAFQRSYRITKWDLSANHNGKWRVQLRCLKKARPDLDFMVHIQRGDDRRLTVEVLRMPFFISFKQAKKEVNQIYNSCRE
ncbi:MAG: hypothetical protein U9N81_07025 [Bacillota bacterium]|nr:hypothetical protein [Bacillota bacterium]